jgi:SAM-dependent methyltransferase
MQSPQFQLHAEIEQRHWWFVGRRRIMRRLIDAVLAPPAMVVDVGCGTGANIAALADSYTCVGIDTSVEAIRLARRRFPQVRFIAGRAPEDLGGLIHQANLFLLMDVLEHIDDDVAMFSELLAAAAPGSYFLVTVPADPSLWSAHDESFGHRRRYDRAGLRRLWADLPVSPVLVSCFNARLLPLVKIVRAWGRRRGRAAGEAGTDFWLPNPALNCILQATLAGEARRLLRLIDNRAGGGYRRGASLLALLRREEGPVRPEPTPQSAASVPE